MDRKNDVTSPSENRSDTSRASTEIFGVDACRSGWIAISSRASSTDGLTMALYRNASDLARASSGARAVGIDIPIGLSKSGFRSCDVAARAALGHRASTVFNAPPRIILGMTDFSAANVLCRSVSGRGISIQSFGLVARIRDIDNAHQSFSCPVWEVHPELSFTQMVGTPLPAKKTPEGRQRRRDAIVTIWPEIDELVDQRPKGCAPDDVLDAAAVLWSTIRATRDHAMTFGDGEIDEHGIAMVIRA